MFPLFLRLTGRRVVVVGGGRVATRRVLSLLEQDARVTVVAPWTSEELQRLDLTGAIVWQRRAFAAGDLEGAWLAVAATSDAAVNCAVSAEAQANRVWCVRSDAHGESDAWMSAAGKFDDVGIAITASGDPRRAVDIRDNIIDQLERGALWAPRHRLFTGGFVTLVGAGPGIGLITIAGLEALRSADVVITDRLVDRGLLAHLPDCVEIIDAGKSPQRHAMTQDEINTAIVTYARAGHAVVRLKGGDPFVFGRGGEEVLACKAAGIEVRVIPGVTSAVAAPAAAGIPITHRSVSSHFTVVSAPSQDDFERLALVGGTLIFLMGVAQLPNIVGGLRRGGMLDDVPVAFVERAYLPGQRVTTSTLGSALAEAASVGLANPAVIVIGDVVGALALVRAT